MRTWGFQTLVTVGAIAVVIPILLLPLVNGVYRRFGAFGVGAGVRHVDHRGHGVCGDHLHPVPATGA